ncbi:uncharacterized protein LOC115210875 [Argonauta hians]
MDDDKSYKNIESNTMTDVDVNNHLQDFIASGRTGRRNALTNMIDDEFSKVSTGDLSYELEKLKCTDDNPPPPMEGAATGNTSSSSSSSSSTTTAK